MDFSFSMPTFLVVLGLVLLTLEVAVFGFGTLFLVFIAGGCVVTAALMSIGVLEHSYLVAAASTGIFSLLCGLVLWKPLRKMQASHQSPNDQPNVFSDVRFTLADDISEEKSSKHQYSGIEWNVVPGKGVGPIEAGTEVEVVKTAVGKLHVQPVVKGDSSE